MTKTDHIILWENQEKENGMKSMMTKKKFKK